MSGEGLASTTRFLVLALSVLYVVAAVAGPILVEFDSTRNVVLWIVFLFVSAALMLVGQLAVPPGARAALLVSLGAAVGGFLLFWTLLVPVAVAAVVACSIALARRAAPA
jgi:hypothetical protein